MDNIFIIRERQIKTALGCHSIPVRIDIIIKQMTNTGKDVGEGELLYATDGNVSR